MRVAGYPQDTVMDLTPQYSYQFDNIVVTIGNKLRQDDNFTADFSQQLKLDFLYCYLNPQISVQRFVDDSYQFGIQINLDQRQKEVLNIESIYFNLGQESLRIGTNFISF